jgi:S-adenosylmethionine synthetase
VDHASDDHLNTGAGDQGLMFGYACDETPELMPAPIYYAHRLVERQAQLRKDGRLPFLRPDAKSQVTMRYVDGKPHSIDTVVLSTQHSPDQSETQTKMKDSFIEAVIEEIIKPVLPKEWLQGHQVPDQPHRPLRHRRPAGRLRPDRPQDHRRHLRRRLPARRRRLQRQGPDQGGPLGRLRRRYVAKNIVAAGLARQCQIQVAYAIGVAKPMNVTVYTEGTGVIPDEQIAELVQRALRPAPQGHHPDAGPAAPDLREDRRLRPLRPRRARVHLGTRTDSQACWPAGAGASTAPWRACSSTKRSRKPRRKPSVCAP